MATIACLGHVTLDIFHFISSDEAVLTTDAQGVSQLCLPYPEKISVQERIFSVGGNAHNVGAGLLLSDHHVKLITQVGVDPIGPVVFDQLTSKGFDLSLIQRGGESDSAAIIHFGGDRTILSYHTECEYTLPQDQAGLDWLYVSSLGMVDIAQVHGRIQEWLMQFPSVDMLYNPGRSEIEQGLTCILPMASRAHTMIVNKSEAEQLLGHDPVSFNDTALFSEFLQSFINQGVQRLIVTHGKEGAYYIDAEDMYYIASYPVEVVETTGAGDAFSSGYLIGLLSGNAPEQSLSYGVMQSAHVITEAGATNGLLTVNQLNEILNSHPEVKAERLSR